MAKKFFISSDIEGTCGIMDWSETEHDKHGYDHFSEQMSKEVAACCEGILSADSENEILVRDSHDTARNIHPDLLPQVSNLQLYRGWGRDPYSMMSGIDESYSGAMFTGYHSAVGWSGNPLSHTMNGRNFSVKVNGEVMPELMMNSLTAAMFGVPVLLVTGDEQLCKWFKSKVPDALAVPVSHAIGKGSVALMPEEACRRIRAAAEQAAKLDASKCMFPMPEHFVVEVTYIKHFDARGASWYPGVERVDDRTVKFESDKWMDVITFFHYCL